MNTEQHPWEFIEIIREGFRLASNLGSIGADRMRTAVLTYFKPMRVWTIRIAIAAAAPLVVILPCLFLELALGGLYGAYVVWIVLLGTAELFLLTPMYLVWRGLTTLAPKVARELQEWSDFIKSVAFNGLSLAVFVTLFPVWRSPGAIPLLLLILACWVTLPISGISNFFKHIYPAVRAIQLLVLLGVLVMEMAFPQHMKQLGWASSKEIDILLARSVKQKEVTSEWKSITWFSNTGEAQVWYSGSKAEGYRLWAAPGFDQQTGKELRSVRDQSTRDVIVAYFADRDIAANAQRAFHAEEQRRRDAATRALADARRREDQARATEREGEVRRASYLHVTGLPSKVDFIVCSASMTRQVLDTFSSALVAYLRGRDKTASGAVFSPAFVTGGAFDTWFDGRGGTDLRDMPVSSMGSRLFLARVRVNSVKPGTTVAGLFTTSVSVWFSVLSANDGSAVDGFSVSSVGAGTSEADATARALEQVVGQLGQHGY